MSTRGRGTPPLRARGRGTPPLRARGRGAPRGNPNQRRLRPAPPQNKKPPPILKSGFIASLLSKGEIPNAKKFFSHLSLSILKEGMKMSPEVLEIIENSTNAHVNSQQSSQLLSIFETQFLQKLIRKIQNFLFEQKSLKRIVLIQAAVRTWLIRKKIKTLKNPEERQLVVSRNERFKEFLRAEKSFVHSLREVLRLYVIPLRVSDIIEPQEGASLFCNIETVFDEHQNLCKRLQKAQAHWPFLGNIGEIFLDIKPLLNAISTYVGHFKSAINELDRIKEEKPRFKQFTMQVEEAVGSDLATMLLLPVNRISQYEYFLKGMVEFYKPNTLERDDIENATAALAQSSIVVQQSLVESANNAQILQVKQKLRSDKGPLIVDAPGRIFIKEFHFKKSYVCLFSDSILIASKSQKVKEHKFKVILDIKKTELVVDAKNFEVRMGKDVYKFIALSPCDKQDFIRCYNNIVEEINRIKVFGVPLIETIIREEQSSGVPFIVETLTEYILSNGCDVAGIFRVAGPALEIKAIKEDFDSGKQNLAEFRFDEKNIFSICDLLKLYFRELPEPMLGYNLYEPLVNLMKTEGMEDEERVKQIKRALIHWTPPFALKVLKYLLVFLSKIVQHEEKNKMTSNNIAIVFGPTLLWPKNNTLESAMDMPYINGALKIIIENYQQIVP